LRQAIPDTAASMILLVEDSEDDVFLMERALQKASIDRPMHVATDGRQALEYLQGIGKYADRKAYPIPALIFLDLKLPFVHGFQVLEWISGQPSLKHVPVAVLSSSPEEKDRDKAKQLGARVFLVKPPTGEMLREVFQSLAGDPVG
jgi:CheY-like chemotaxis protein